MAKRKSKRLDIQAAKPNEPNVMAFRADVEIEAAKGEGKLPTFKINAYNGGPMMLSGFFHPVIVDLGGVKAAENVVILADHDPTRIIGQGTASISGESIEVTGTVMAEDANAAQVLTLAKNGFKWQASVGMGIARREFLEAGKKTTVNGREVVGPAILARETNLVETSFVAVGADSTTSAQIAATSPKEIEMTEFEKWIAAKGWDPSTVSDSQKVVLQAAFDAEKAARDSQPRNISGLDDIMAAQRKETARQSGITTITASFVRDNPYMIDELEAAARKAIEDGTTVEAFELNMLRATRGKPGNIGTRKSSEVPTDKVIEAALCQHLRVKDHEKQYDTQTLEAAHKRWKGRLGLQELLIVAARAAGHDMTAIKSDGAVRSALRAAFQPELRAGGGFSTIDVSGILSNVANKSLIDAFNSVDSSWRKITAIRSVSDFKQITSYSLTGDLQYEEVGPGGEIPHGTLGEESYTNQAKTFGKMLAVTRTDIINDDLGAFAKIPTRLGRGGALKLNDVFWTEFGADHSTFFTTGRGNYSTDNAATVSAAGMALAVALWDLQTDPDGKPLGTSARYLLVPPAQWEAAMRLMASTTYNSGGAASTELIPSSNVWAGMFEVVKSPYLQNSTYISANGDTGWYLIGDPANLPMIETCFLGGQETPTVESADADFDVLGVKFRAYHDFGVNKQEYRGAVKLNPAA